MAKNILAKAEPKVVNAELEKLVEVQANIAELKTQVQNSQQSISENFSDSVIVFVDLVDSTAFKLANPEAVWILRVKLFVDVISQYATELGGDIVKVIGDEVMIAFNRKEQINDSLNFVMRLKEIENVLKDTTGHPTKIKIAMDGGKVCFIKYAGHDTPDPQGTPVDRCARISKYCSASTVLTSENTYFNFEHKDLWKFIGKPNLKGIGPVSIYQLGSATIKVEDTKTISISEYNQYQRLIEENKKLNEKNRKLQQQVVRAGKKPDQAAVVVDNQEEEDWKRIEDTINEVNKLIDGAPSNRSQYARFIFLYQIGDYEKYDSFNGVVFDDLIQAGLVYSEEDNSYYCLRPGNKRNEKVLSRIDELEKLLTEFQEVYGEINEEELFDHSVKDPEFWENYMNYKVI